MKSALVIEDDEGVIQSVFTTLIGYAKKSAGTMTEAIKALQEHEFDVVFLDLALPDSTASRTLQMIPMIRILAKDASVILMTGYPDAIGNAQFAVDSILTKPFHSGHIREALADANLSLYRSKCGREETVQLCRAFLAFP